MSTRKPKKIVVKRPAMHPENMLKAAFTAFERSEGPFYEGMKLLKAAQNDFTACAKNKNLYSHALRALRHIAQQPCAPGCKLNFESQRADQYADVKLCWPCYARNALRQGGEKA